MTTCQRRSNTNKGRNTRGGGNKEKYTRSMGHIAHMSNRQWSRIDSVLKDLKFLKIFLCLCNPHPTLNLLRPKISPRVTIYTIAINNMPGCLYISKSKYHDIWVFENNLWSRFLCNVGPLKCDPTMPIGVNIRAKLNLHYLMMLLHKIQLFDK